MAWFRKRKADTRLAFPKLNLTEKRFEIKLRLEWRGVKINTITIEADSNNRDMVKQDLIRQLGFAIEGIKEIPKKEIPKKEIQGEH